MKRIFPALLALLLVLSFTGCASRTTESSSSSSAASEKPAQSASPSPDVSEFPNDTSVMPETALGLSAFRDALREAYGDKYYPDTKLTEDEIRSELGMDDSLYEEVYAENTAQKAHPDTFIDEDFTASKDKIEAAEIYADGDYVFFLLLGEPETSGESSEGMAEAFGKEIQHGIDAIKKVIGME